MHPCCFHHTIRRLGPKRIRRTVPAAARLQRTHHFCHTIGRFAEKPIKRNVALIEASLFLQIKHSRSRGAAERPSFANAISKKPLHVRKRGEAERRQAHPSIGRINGCGSGLSAARSPLGAPPRRSPGNLMPRLSPGRASRRRCTKELPSPPAALKRSTSRAGRYAGGVDTRTARERGYKPRPQEPHPPHQRLSPVTSLDGRADRACIQIGD